MSGEREIGEIKNVEALEVPQCSTKVVFLFDKPGTGVLFDLNDFGDQTLEQIYESIDNKYIYAVRSFQEVTVDVLVNDSEKIRLRSEKLNISGIGYLDGQVFEVEEYIEQSSDFGKNEIIGQHIGGLSDKLVVTRNGRIFPFFEKDFVVKTKDSNPTSQEG